MPLPSWTRFGAVANVMGRDLQCVARQAPTRAVAHVVKIGGQVS